MSVRMYVLPIENYLNKEKTMKNAKYCVQRKEVICCGRRKW